MEVILLQRVEKLGQMGDVVTVKPGHARNRLLPQGMALRANKANLAVFEAKKVQLEADNLDRRKEAEAVAENMGDVAVTLVRQASDVGHLYGSVTARDISNAVTEAGFTVARTQVVLDQPIKTLGLHQVKINLHPEVAIEVTANVARSEEDAAEQLRKGGAVLGTIDEMEADEALEAAEEVFEEDAVAEEAYEAEGEEEANV
ncbi:50S ribosomal protein L9 [Thalassospira alkalitolerans]|uniref:Large ribosomal subunit protein bL9 n=1 Tax=Thalassospira alkalitolerans TaxID=1293890 RepID=A0A1Y2L810_9PROT|nr:50S ribosomal protein L9 [Thalassospira alkalitolerans]OSQ44908.1 50S ribosomal protein L9 [Thalassospira alkalitolerans]|tara:strand:- start:23951 stop:24556 length:606 start_codon:yes stop_codon:yes gene_type:complete